VHGNERVYTFWHYLRNRWQRDAGLRLDHLLVSPAVAERLVSAGVDREVRGRPGAAIIRPHGGYQQVGAGVGKTSFRG
jgi:exodeoxyribonuclease III